MIASRKLHPYLYEVGLHWQCCCLMLIIQMMQEAMQRRITASTAAAEALEEALAIETIVRNLR